jgi:hypothetical protein
VFTIYPSRTVSFFFHPSSHIVSLSLSSQNPITNMCIPTLVHTPNPVIFEPSFTLHTFPQRSADYLSLAEAPKAIKSVIIFAQKAMGVKDVRTKPSGLEVSNHHPSVSESDSSERGMTTRVQRRSYMLWLVSLRGLQASRWVWVYAHIRWRVRNADGGV